MNRNQPKIISTLTLKGPKKSWLKIEYTSDLIHWVALPLIQADDNGNVNYIHTSSSSNLFFRATFVSPPTELMQPLKFSIIKPPIFMNVYRKIFPNQRPPIVLNNP